VITSTSLRTLPYWLLGIGNHPILDRVDTMQWNGRGRVRSGSARPGRSGLCPRGGIARASSWARIPGSEAVACLRAVAFRRHRRSQAGRARIRAGQSGPASFLGVDAGHVRRSPL